MNILLINKNPIISRLVTLCMHDDNITFEELEYLTDITLDKYDIIFVDGDSYSTSVEALLSLTEIELKVLFLESDSTLDYDEEVFTHTIEKPFLPSQIKDIIHTLTPIKSTNTPEILDANEIDKIKSLLIEDDSELVIENDIVDIISKKEDSFTLEEKILSTLKGMKIKKIKKLLEGAEINISIKFKDSK